MNDTSIMGRLTKIYFPTLYKFVNLKDFLNCHLSLKENTFGAMIIIIMVMTKITRMIIIDNNNNNNNSNNNQKYKIHERGWLPLAPI